MEETSDARIDIYYQHPFFQARPGLAEAIIQYEQLTGLKLPNEFKIPPFVYYLNKQVVFGKVHQAYLFGIETKGVTNYRLFANKQAFKLFFTQMSGLEKTDLVFWLTQIEDLEYTINRIIEQGGLPDEQN